MWWLKKKKELLFKIIHLIHFYSIYHWLKKEEIYSFLIINWNKIVIPVYIYVTFFNVEHAVLIIQHNATVVCLTATFLFYLWSFYTHEIEKNTWLVPLRHMKYKIKSSKRKQETDTKQQGILADRSWLLLALALIFGKRNDCWTEQWLAAKIRSIRTGS